MMSPYAQDKKLYDLVRPEGNLCGVFSIVNHPASLYSTTV